jgi:hypothetical protein
MQRDLKEGGEKSIVVICPGPGKQGAGKINVSNNCKMLRV